MATVSTQDEPRVNEKITASEVLLIDEKNEKRGVVKILEALNIARLAELDLVEVAPMAKPPVCRILNYGKYRFQQQKREHEARKKQKVQEVKEIKMRPKTDVHDFDFKLKAILSFLKDGDKVKVSVFFRGREMAFLDRGKDLLARVVHDVGEWGTVDTEPKMEGAHMRMMLSPAANLKQLLKKEQESRVVVSEQEVAQKEKKAPTAPKKKNVIFDADQI
ncbi:MAG: translation initiation factor IF-3 [Synergistaceae bacterium]|nr:translation initiation factor IF-3 [Synergistaceae bacterium]